MKDLQNFKESIKLNSKKEKNAKIKCRKNKRRGSLKKNDICFLSFVLPSFH
jgi:hypothetical protein